MKNGPYILVKAPFDYPGLKYRGKYVYEHQLVWWQYTKIIPPNGYQIHHKNSDKHDNRYENLEMVFKGTHSKLHGLSKKKGWTLLNCCWCKKPFKIETRNHKAKAKQGQKHFHCSRSCQVKRQQKLLHRSSVGSQHLTVNEAVVGSSPTGVDLLDPKDQYECK